MPSRQLECRLDPQGQEAHELRASIQDLHDLCRDMLREINELKSVNLTLRCAVEGLRHDDEEKGRVIADLMRRLEALEGAARGGWGAGGARADDFERYSTPEPELEGRVRFEVIPPNSSEHYSDDYGGARADRDEQDRLSDCTLVQRDDVAENKEAPTESVDHDAHEQEGEIDLDARVEDALEDEQEVLSIASNREADRYEEAAVGGKAEEQYSKEFEGAEEQEQHGETPQKISDENANYSSDAEEHFRPWQPLSEDLESQVTELEDRLFKSIVSSAEGNLSNDEETEEDEEYDDESNKLEPGRRKRDLSILEEGFEPEVDLAQEKHVEESHADSDAFSEKGEGTEDYSIADTEEYHPEALEHDEGADVEEGEKRLEEGEEGVRAESRLEGEHEALAEDGEGQVEGGQPREAETEGEPRPEAEERLAEGAEEGETQPAEPPPPMHTEEDLWEYLKETVTSVHPSTVEEFVQNLIGTLQHVPEEYLKPVIDANIKRVNSPTLSEGEHLTSQEHTEEGRAGEAPAEPSAPVGEEGSSGAPGEESGEPVAAEGDQDWPQEGTKEGSPQEQPAEAEPGYSAVEAAA